MNIRDEILTEFNSLSKMDKGTTLFQVPEDYFISFPEQVVENIRLASATPPVLPRVEEDTLAVPVGYFFDFPGKLMDKIREMDVVVHHNTLPWTDQLKTTPYRVPLNYFENFCSNLLKIIKGASESEEVPADAVTEIGQLSPLLAELRKEQPFSVPDGYFGDTRHSDYLTTKSNKKRVLEFQSLKSIKWARWMAAASVLFIFSIGGWHFFIENQSLNKTGGFEEALARIPDAKIKEWLSNNLDEEDINSLDVNIVDIRSNGQIKSLNSLSSGQLDDYLKNEAW